MNLETKKNYIKKFVCQSIDFDKACALSYCDEDEKTTILEDETFMQEMNEFKLQLSLKNIEAYNLKVDISPSPSDELKRLTSVMGVLDSTTIEIPGELTINYTRGSKD